MFIWHIESEYVVGNWGKYDRSRFIQKEILKTKVFLNKIMLKKWCNISNIFAINTLVGNITVIELYISLNTVETPYC